MSLSSVELLGWKCQPIVGQRSPWQAASFLEIRFGGTDSMLRRLLIMSAFVTASSAFGADQPSVRLESSNLHGPRPLQEQTEKAVIRDYLQSWESLSAAFEQNRPDLLDRDF